MGLSDEQARAITRIVDRRNKLSADDFISMLAEIVNDVDILIAGLDSTDPSVLGESSLMDVLLSLQKLGITNVHFDASIARGFDYYTGIVFEIFDTSPENNRAMLGGGRYDNLTGLFGGEPITGIGFGFGDVVMRDFLTTHNLLPSTVSVTSPTLIIVPTDETKNIAALVLADSFRKAGISTSIDSSDKKLGKKIGNASAAGVRYVIVLGDDELTTQTFTLKYLISEDEKQGSITELINAITQ